VYLKLLRNELKDIQEYELRYTTNVDDVYIVHDFKIPSDFEKDHYFVKVLAYDVAASEDKIGEIYASVFNLFDPDYDAAKKFVAGKYGDLGLIRSRNWQTLKFARNVDFFVVDEETLKKEPGELPPEAAVPAFSNVGMDLDFISFDSEGMVVHRLERKFLKEELPTLNITLKNISHKGVVSLDLFFILLDEEYLPVNVDTMNYRYKEYPSDIIKLQYRVNRKLPPGQYYLDVRLYDTGNEYGKIALSKLTRNQKVLDGLNLRIPRNKTTVIIGRSGGGKSVTLKHMIGLMRPDLGQILVDGKEIRGNLIVPFKNGRVHKVKVVL